MSSSVIDKLDQLLKNDANLDTRAGLHFTLELVKDCFKYIDSEKAKQEKEREQIASLFTRISHLETGFNDFLQLRKDQHKTDEAERQKWRWVIITPTAGFLVLEILKWMFP